MEFLRKELQFWHLKKKKQKPYANRIKLLYLDVNQ